MRKRWTAEEDRILIEFYPTEHGSVYHRLEGRTPDTCRARAKSLGLTRGYSKWTQEECDILREFYLIEGDEVYKRLPGRTKCTCATKASVMRLTKGRGYWTAEEDRILEEFYPMMGVRVISELPNRTVAAIATRVGMLGIKCLVSKERRVDWLEEELDILREYYPIEGVLSFSRLPRHSYGACCGRVTKLGLKSHRCDRKQEGIITS